MNYFLQDLQDKVHRNLIPEWRNYNPVIEMLCMLYTDFLLMYLAWFFKPGNLNKCFKSVLTTHIYLGS